MKHRILLILVAFLFVFAAACQPAAPAPATEAPAATEAPSGEPILEFLASDGTSQSFTLADVQAMTATEGQAGIKSSTGKITLPTLFKGVLLKDLAMMDPKFDDSMGITLYAVDGYSITFSYDQVMKGDFIQYDPGSGDELKSPQEVQALVAYEMDGKLLNPQMDGYLRLVVISAEPKQVVDGHWSVKFINKIEVKPVGKVWNLELEGAISETMDRATFESGASPNCHGVTWKDDKGQEWLGIPLWLLVGRVDDDVKHEGPAFNDVAADKGYTVDVIASDGYTVSFDIAKLKRVDTILVAYLVDGAELPEKYFPLRLVGDGLAKNEMVGAISKIVVHLDKLPEAAAAEAATEAPAAPAAEGDLNITGKVTTPLALSDADLRALEVVKITAEHPKKGKQEYEGIRLKTLLDKAGVSPDATKLVLTASDGYKSEVFLKEVNACADCMVSFSDTPGNYSLVMPGLPSSVWTKGIVSIDVQ